jgi:hypothetical protein
MAETLQSTAERLRQKYGPKPQDENREAFQSTAEPKVGRQRVSSSPRTAESGEAEALYRNLATIQMGLAELAEEQGKLDVRFKDVVGSKKYLNYGDLVKIVGYNLLLQKRKVIQVKIDASARKGEVIDGLTDRIAEVIVQKHQNAIRGVELAHGVQAQTTEHIKTVRKNQIRRLNGSYVGDLDLANGEKNVSEIEKELADYDEVISDYEAKIIATKKTGDVAGLEKLVSDLTQVVEDHGMVLDKKQEAENIVHEIRRKIMDYTEGVRSARNALEALSVSDSQANALIDSWNKIEIKYRHANEDMVEIYRIQGKIAAYGANGLEMNKVLQQTADLYRQLLEHNEKLVMALTKQTFDLIQTDLYDPAKCKEAKARLTVGLEEQKNIEIAWAQNQQIRTDALKSANEYMKQNPLPAGPTYTKQK